MRAGGDGVTIPEWPGSRNDRATAARADETAAKTDKDKLQGKWKITEAVLHGRPLPLERAVALLGDTVEFKGDKVTLRTESTFTLDPSKSPKWIDMPSADGRGSSGCTRWTATS